MKLKFVATRKRVAAKVQVFIIQDNGFVSNAGTLYLYPEEFEAFKFMILEGAGRYMNKEVAVEFEDNSRVQAYTEGT